MTEKKKVLVIDDEEMHLYTAKGLIENGDIEVITHRGSFGATNRVREVQPDLILLDINMPALSGETLVTIIQPCNGKKVPILFYSSNDEATLKRLAVKHDVNGYVCKGDVLGLQNKVRECLATNLS